MPVTLAEAKLNTQDDLQIGIIDEFQKSSFILDHITFDDAVTPTGGGGTLTYAYTRLKTQPTAAFRAINTEYTAQEVERERFHVDLKVFGGAYQIDRIINATGGIVNEVTLQSSQKVKAANALFNDTVINGDTGTNAQAFDGLDKALTGSSTEFSPAAPIDLSTSAAIDSNYKAFLDQFDEYLMGLDGAPTFIGGNTAAIAKLRAVARRVGMYQTDKDEWGNQVERYGVTPLIDLGAKPGTNNPVVPVNANGTTSLYAVRFGLDGFHAVSLAGQHPVKMYLPDFATPGAVKTGEVEMVAAVALKATKAAGVFRGLKVKPAA
jgi:hypothetical protein